VPGGGSIETLEWITENEYLMANLSYGGYLAAQNAMNSYWQMVGDMKRDPNPYRAGFLQLVGVSETDKQAEEDYAEAAEYFYKKCLHIDRGFADVAGYRSLRSLELSLRGGRPSSSAMFSGNQGWQDYLRQGNIIAGSVERVTEQLRDLITNLRIGHLMVLIQFGNMSKEVTNKNTRLFAEQVIPNLRDLWDDQWEDKWWIKPIAKERAAQPLAVS
jgi:alkanesulfonate monooxygenase SsuD/methylene tetrahydromethanopterin reductase-like flavin-dependent oxidoreductase (luciferase family)